MFSCQASLYFGGKRRTYCCHPLLFWRKQRSLAPFWRASKKIAREAGSHHGPPPWKIRRCALLNPRHLSPLYHIAANKATFSWEVMWTYVPATPLLVAHGCSGALPMCVGVPILQQPHHPRACVVRGRNGGVCLSADQGACNKEAQHSASQPHGTMWDLPQCKVHKQVPE